MSFVGEQIKKYRNIKGMTEKTGERATLARSFSRTLTVKSRT